MRERERKMLVRRLDVEMRSIRRAALVKDPTRGLLRAVRQALRIPVDEIMEKMGVGYSEIFALEARELKQTASLQCMDRMAKAMGCKVVYGIVPENGKTLAWLEETRLWRAVLGKDGLDQGSGVTDQFSGAREQGMAERMGL